MMHVRGKTVLLTGATGGIGHAIAREFSARGAVLTLTGRRVEVLQQLASELGATFTAADLTQSQEVARLIDEVGQVDVFVANAGVAALGKLGDFAAADIDDALAVNLRTPMLMARHLVPLMQQRAAGHIVFIGSIGGRVPAADAAIYDATKFGLRGFALGLRQDLHHTGVGVSIVEPGFIRGAGRGDARKMVDDRQEAGQAPALVRDAHADLDHRHASPLKVTEDRLLVLGLARGHEDEGAVVEEVEVVCRDVERMRGDPGVHVGVHASEVLGLVRAKLVLLDVDRARGSVGVVVVLDVPVEQVDGVDPGLGDLVEDVATGPAQPDDPDAMASES